jgi:hypothetical protein
MKNNGNILTWLQVWFYKNCNEDWEHNTNIKIVNLDNPGWSIFINLEGTDLEDKEFEQFKDYRTENDWVYCTLENKIFKGACGPFNLEEMLNIFKKWVDDI